MKLFTLMETAFENFDNTIKEYLSKSLGAIGQRYSNTQIFGIIFNGIQAVMENIMFYIEDALTEQNVYTATRKKSVYSLAKISGYEPFYGSAASGTIIGRVRANTAANASCDKIYINNRTPLINKNSGSRYTIILPTDFYSIDLNKPLVMHEFKVVQGYFAEVSYTAKGFSLETIHVSSSGMWDANYLTVIVDGVEYTQASCLYDMGFNENQYVVTVGYDNAFDIMFGNITYGTPLYEGQTVIVRYLTHTGKTGNIYPGENTVIEFNSAGTNDLGEAVNLNTYMYIEMNNIINGGTDSDTIEDVKSMIGYNSRSLVLVNENNFKIFFRRFSFIDYIHIWSTDNSMTLCVSCLSNYKPTLNANTDYFKINTNNLFLTDYQRDSIMTCLENSNKTFAGVSVKFEDPIIRKFAMVVFVKIDNEYDKENIKHKISDEIAKYFMAIDTNTTFIAKSDIISKIVESDNRILSFDFNFLSELAEQTYYNGYYFKYKWQVLNNEYQYIPYKVMYEPNSQPGLDKYGNISLDSDLEIPFLIGGFSYYTDKDSFDKKTSIITEPIQFFFI